MAAGASRSKSRTLTPSTPGRAAGQTHLIPGRPQRLFGGDAHQQLVGLGRGWAGAVRHRHCPFAIETKPGALSLSSDGLLTRTASSPRSYPPRLSPHRRGDSSTAERNIAVPQNRRTPILLSPHHRGDSSTANLAANPSALSHHLALLSPHHRGDSSTVGCPPAATRGRRSFCPLIIGEIPQQDDAAQHPSAP
jgi:hypothetical protein